MMLKEIVEKVSAETGLSQKKVKEVIRSFFKYLEEEFRIAKPGDNLRIQGYGTFKVVKRAPKRGRNPRTGEEIKIPARKVLTFKPSEAFVEELTD